jgi:hypothetical protein
MPIVGHYRGSGAWAHRRFAGGVARYRRPRLVCGDAPPSAWVGGVAGERRLGVRTRLRTKGRE